jgi:cytochrome c peroxidase
MKYLFKHSYKTTLVIVSFILIVISCKKDISLPNSSNYTEQISFKVPNGWPSPYYQFTNNPLTQKGFELGRKLFYDTRLSIDNTVSCGTCHQNFAAFANAGHDLSHGVDGLLGIRNSPPLFNLNWHPAFMWDGGINHLEVQPLSPIINPVEMGETITNVISKLQQDQHYRTAFKEAFGDTIINSARTFKALAQFMGAMVSSDSKWDRYQEGNATLTPQELEGEIVFTNKCASCHKAPLFSDFTYRNVGLAANNLHDSGRYVITLDINDLYKFKVPTLRNLSYTAPYGHDGRFATIDEVLQQKESEIVPYANLDPLMQHGISLSTTEKNAIKAFLKTLDDETFVKDKRFAQPI